MPKYDQLTALQTKTLTDIVDASRRYGDESFLLLASFGGASLLGTTSDVRIDKVPGVDVFYFGLAAEGFIVCAQERELHITLQGKAFDYVDYTRLSAARRHRADLVYDLGHDTTFRSKIAWALIAVGLSYLFRWLFGLVGVHL